MTFATDAVTAVAEIAQQLGSADLDAVFLFCSAAYDLDRVGVELQQAFQAPVIACSSAGQIGPRGFQVGGMAAIGFSGGYLQVVPHLIQPLNLYQERAQQIAEAIRVLAPPPERRRTFGFLVIDGLSLMEERVASALFHALDDVPIVGGSAGDDLAFRGTRVYHQGRFLSDAAVLAICRARGPVAPFMVKHFVPGDAHLVITDAEPEQRLIREFNGEPAAQAYAEAIGLRPDQLAPVVFSRHPLLIKVGEEHYVRSISRANPDGSLVLYCAIDLGRVVTVGVAMDPVAALDRTFAALARTVPNPLAVLACDCVLRRLELEDLGRDREVGDYLARHRVLGFSTYGEQIDGLHVNQTLTGIALGLPETP
jgi:hypothetical protein